MKFGGIYRGTVVNNADPENTGRLVLLVPAVLGDAMTTWAHPVATPGFPILLPKPGELVWVQFEGGSSDAPVWTGVAKTGGEGVVSFDALTVGTLSASGMATFTGGAHFLATTGDSIVRIEADAANVDEQANAALYLHQDGRLVTARLATTAANDLELINEYGASLNLGTGNVTRLTVGSDGRITSTAGLLTLQNGNAEVISTGNLYLRGASGGSVILQPNTGLSPGLTITSTNAATFTGAVTAPQMEVNGTSAEYAFLSRGAVADTNVGKRWVWYASAGVAYLYSNPITGTGSGNRLTVTSAGDVSFTGTLTGGTVPWARLSGVPSSSLIGNWGQQDGHTLYTTNGFNGPTDFGGRFIQGTANGPGIPGAGQYYNFALSLGSEYPYSQYAMQWAVPRISQGGTAYLSFRFREGGTWGGWEKVRAGNADTVTDGVYASTTQTITGAKTLTGNTTLSAITTLTRSSTGGNGAASPGGSYRGALHFAPATATNGEQTGLTWTGGTTDLGAQAGLLVSSDSTLGTKMNFYTTNSYATGLQRALEIDHVGAVTAHRGVIAGNNVGGNFRAKGTGTDAGDGGLWADASGNTYVGRWLGDNTLRFNVGGGITQLGTGAVTLAGQLNTAGAYVSGARVNIGDTAVNYPGAGQSFWAANWNSNILLSGLDQTSISFHDSGTRVDTLRVEGAQFKIGIDAGWGVASTRIYGALSVDGTSTFSGTAAFIGASTFTTTASILNGQNGSTFTGSQLNFGYAGAKNYQHSIRTRHNSGATASNAFDFYVWTPGHGTTAESTSRIFTIDGALVESLVPLTSGGEVWAGSGVGTGRALALGNASGTRGYEWSYTDGGSGTLTQHMYRYGQELVWTYGSAGGPVEAMRLSNGVLKVAGNVTSGGWYYAAGGLRPDTDTGGDSVAIYTPGATTTWDRALFKATTLWENATTASEYGTSTKYATLGAVESQAGIMLANPHVVNSLNTESSAASARIRYGRVGGLTTGAYWDAGILTKTTDAWGISRNAATTAFFEVSPSTATFTVDGRLNKANPTLLLSHDNTVSSSPLLELQAHGVGIASTVKIQSVTLASTTSNANLLTITATAGVTVSNALTVNGTVTVPDLSFNVSKLSATGTRDATTYLRGDNTWSTDVATLATAQTITGAKTFSAAPSFALAPTGTGMASIAEQLRAGINITGGGTVTYNAGLRWTTRFIVMANGRGAHFGTSGYFDIAMPADGSVITGVGGRANVTVNATNGIPLASWDALYYVLPIGSASGSAVANFRVAHYTADLEIPANWVLVALVNGDGGTCWVPGAQVSLDSGGSINTTLGTHRNQYVTITDTQTISGAKTFSAAATFNSTVTVPDLSFNVSKLSATGTRSATTFLRGDNTWATNVVTTDTTQTLSGLKYFTGRLRTGFNANVALAPLTTSAAEFELSSQSMVAIGESVAADANPQITFYRTAGGLRSGRALRQRLNSSNGPFSWGWGSSGDAAYGAETVTEVMTLSTAGLLTTTGGLSTTGATTLATVNTTGRAWVYGGGVTTARVASDGYLRLGAASTLGTTTTAAGQENSRHELAFSTYRDAVPDTLGAKITAFNYSHPSYVNGVVQVTDLVFSTQGGIPSVYDSTVERMRITSAGEVRAAQGLRAAVTAGPGGSTNSGVDLFIDSLFA